jgi:hypothetical protein
MQQSPSGLNFNSNSASSLSTPPSVSPDANGASAGTVQVNLTPEMFSLLQVLSIQQQQQQQQQQSQTVSSEPGVISSSSSSSSNAASAASASSSSAFSNDDASVSSLLSQLSLLMPSAPQS